MAPMAYFTVVGDTPLFDDPSRPSYLCGKGSLFDRGLLGFKLFVVISYDFVENVLWGG